MVCKVNAVQSDGGHTFAITLLAAFATAAQSDGRWMHRLQSDGCCACAITLLVFVVQAPRSDSGFIIAITLHGLLMKHRRVIAALHSPSLFVGCMEDFEE